MYSVTVYMKHSRSQCSQRILLPLPPEQKSKARRQPPAECRRSGWPPISGLRGIIGSHVWGWCTHSLYPGQSNTCQPACCSIDQPNKGSFIRYAVYQSFLLLLVENECSWNKLNQTTNELKHKWWWHFGTLFDHLWSVVFRGVPKPCICSYNGIFLCTAALGPEDHISAVLDFNFAPCG